MLICNSCSGTIVYIFGNIVKCEYCGRFYTASNGALSDVEPEMLYIRAVNMSKNHRDEEGLTSAIQIFEALDSYKDSSMRVDSCRDMLKKSRAEAVKCRLEAERQAKKRKAIFVTASVAVILIAMICISRNIKRASAYSKALELNGNGQYEEALQVFNDLGDYSDAAMYASKITSFLKEREDRYEKGVSYYEKGAYSECLNSLADIADYLDAEDYIEKAADVIYRQAKECYEAGEFEKAKQLLEEIPDSSSQIRDVELLLADIEDIIIEQSNAETYRQAQEYYSNGNYEAAQRLFMKIYNYEDAATYLSAIGDEYYGQAEKLYNEGNYVKCGEVLNLIDTAEEWSDYTRAVELLESAKGIYQAQVSEKAKTLCRTQGYYEMTSFVDENVCALLTSDEASAMKTACTVEKKLLQDINPYMVGTYPLEEAVAGKSGTVDSLGNNYQFSLSPGYKEVCSYSYYLGGEYAYLQGTIGIRQRDNGESGYGLIRIYGDGALLWEDNNVTKETLPYLMKINIEGIEILKIEMQPVGIRPMLFDPTLSE